MKKIFTLVFSFGILSSLFAQSESFYSRPPSAPHAIVISTRFETVRYNEIYSFSKYERDQQIAQLNQKYNMLMKSVVNMRFLNTAEKIKMIREIEHEKTIRTDAVRLRFNDSRNKYNDWYYDKHFNRIR